MNKNPFTSSTFENIWTKYYESGKKVISLNFIVGTRFIKSKFFPIYINVGRNFTNGITYSIKPGERGYKGKVVLLYDVPSYYSVENEEIQIKLTKVRQYNGFYGDLSRIQNSEDILAANFKSSKSKYNFKRSLKQFEERHNASYKTYFGDISKVDYDKEMSVFRSLIDKRFDEMNTFNTVLPMWPFYEELIYPLILERKIVLNVIYNDNQPIAMSINFLNDQTLLVSIRTFDVDYFKMNIGNIEIYKLIEWSIANNIKIIDFSKGESYYKKRWTSDEYYYEHHILYDKKSLVAVLIAHGVITYFKFKQFLREKNINAFYVKLKYLPKRLFSKTNN